MGGIDEIGVFLIPALLAIYVLRRAERQARKRAEAEAADQPRRRVEGVAASAEAAVYSV